MTGEFDRPLTQGELMELAASIAADPGLWRHHVAFSRTDDEGRHYVNIRRDDNVDVWVLCWTSSNDTGWHDHDISSGAVAVVQGRLLEHNLGVGRPEVVTDVESGQIYSFGPDHIHRLTGSPGVEGGSVSIHVYSPPLVTMGQYIVDDYGVLHRTSVSYADELKYTGQVPA
ncbi:MAG: cysteine dioxygenase [Williamsia herbipolensis]|nr:cysteine dioxygenase [Williamsia herbipolensis]